MNRAAACAWGLAAAVFVQGASAQQPLPASAASFVSPAFLPPLTLPSILSPGDESDDRGDLAPRLAAEPLRLSLTSTIFPIGEGSDQCKTRTDASGNSIHGFPIRRFQALRLAPHLTLAGFSEGGCPIDGGMGGGVSYAAPLPSSFWLVASAGYYAVPGRGPALPARTSSDIRLDLVKQIDSGRTFHFGVEQKRGTGVTGAPVMVTFGMGF
jgi:hypothetical protein